MFNRQRIYLFNIPIIIKKLVGYFGVGGVAAAVDASCFYIAKYLFDFHYLLAFLLGFIPGMTVNFLLCHWFLFHRVKLSVTHAYFRHVFSSLISLCVNLVVLVILIQKIQFHNYLLARIIAIGVGFIISFLSIRYFAFRDNWFYRQTS